MVRYIRENEHLLRDLELLRGMGLPQSFIAAGYIRNMVWDRLNLWPQLRLID